MSWGFRRPYRLLQLVFPQSGMDDATYPTRVDSTVQPIWNALKPRPGDVLFDSRALIGTSSAPGEFTLSSSASPVPAGKIRIITSGAVFNGDAAARNCRFQISQRAGTPAPPWGSWWTLAGGDRVVSVRNGVPSLAWNDCGNFPLWFEDTDIEAVFAATTGGGETFQFHFTFVELDGSLVDVELRKLS